MVSLIWMGNGQRLDGWKGGGRRDKRLSRKGDVSGLGGKQQGGWWVVGGWWSPKVDALPKKKYVPKVSPTDTQQMMRRETERRERTEQEQEQDS